MQNNHTFQRFAVKSSKAAEDLAKKVAEQAKRSVDVSIAAFLTNLFEAKTYFGMCLCLG
jgi:hypothetical protein